MSDNPNAVGVDLSSLTVLIQCNDGTVRQVYISKENSTLLSHFIAQLEGGQLNISANPLDVSIVNLNNDSTGT